MASSGSPGKGKDNGDGGRASERGQQTLPFTDPFGGGGSGPAPF